jgi:polar amino acid transport system permease protein
MSQATEDRTPDTRTSSAVEQVEFKPHRRWYQRPDVLVPVVLVLIGFGFLAMTGRGQEFYRAPFTADADKRFHAEFFWALVPQMLRGLYITARATVLGFAVAVVLGFVLALGRRSQVRLVRWPVWFVIEFIRSTPLLVQLIFLQALLRATPGVSLAPVEILVLGLGIHYGTYASEAYRAGINSVPKGQWEASIALNLSPWTKWTKIIIPQAVPNVLPALGNYLVAGFKDAPMGMVLGVTGVLFFANTIRNTAFRPVEPYLLIGVGFLLASMAAAWAVRRLEERIEYERT